MKIGVKDKWGRDIKQGEKIRLRDGSVGFAAIVVSNLKPCIADEEGFIIRYIIPGEEVEVINEN